MDPEGTLVFRVIPAHPPPAHLFPAFPPAPVAPVAPVLALPTLPGAAGRYRLLTRRNENLNE